MNPASSGRRLLPISFEVNGCGIWVCRNSIWYMVFSGEWLEGKKKIRVCLFFTAFFLDLPPMASVAAALLFRTRRNSVERYQYLKGSVPSELVDLGFLVGVRAVGSPERGRIDFEAAGAPDRPASCEAGGE